MCCYNGATKDNNGNGAAEEEAEEAEEETASLRDITKRRELAALQITATATARASLRDV